MGGSSAAAAAAAGSGWRFLAPYYVANTLLVAAFAGAGAYFRAFTPDGSDHSRLHSVHALGAWERQALTVYVLALTWRLATRQSWDHYAQTVFFYGKLITAVTLLQVDSRLLCWYCLLCWAVAAMCPQPMCALWSDDDEADDVVTELTPATFKELVTGQNDVPWLVFCYTSRHAPSAAMAPAFLQIAKRYARTKLRCGCLDVLLWPGFARELRITPSTWFGQLPALLLFAKGKEAGRLPQVDEVGVSQAALTRRAPSQEQVIKQLHLDRYAGSSAAAAAPAGTGGS